MKKIIGIIIAVVLFFGVPVALFVHSLQTMDDAVSVKIYPMTNANIELKGGQLWSWEND